MTSVTVSELLRNERACLVRSLAGDVPSSGLCRVTLMSTYTYATFPNDDTERCYATRQGDLGFNGHPTTHTPNIDALAHGGKILTSWYSGCPVCSGYVFWVVRRLFWVVTSSVLHHTKLSRGGDTLLLHLRILTCALC